MDRANGHEETLPPRARLGAAVVLAVCCTVVALLLLRAAWSSGASDGAADSAVWAWAALGSVAAVGLTSLGWVWRANVRRNWRASRQQVQRLVDILDSCFWQTDARHTLTLWRPPMNSPESIWEGAGLVGQPLWDAWEVLAPTTLDAWRARLSARAPVIDLRVRRADRPAGAVWLMRGVARFDSMGRFLGYEGTLRLEAERAAVAADAPDAGTASAPVADPSIPWGFVAAALDGLDGPAVVIGWSAQSTQPCGPQVVAANRLAAVSLGAGPGARSDVRLLWAERAGAATRLDAAFNDALDEVRLRSGSNAATAAGSTEASSPAEPVSTIRRVCGSALVLHALPALQDPADPSRRYALLTLDGASVGDESAALDDQEAFTYAVSHDLRAPLRVVDGFARILKEDYGRVLDRIGNDHLERILGAAGRMNGMIDALLGQAKLSTRPLQREPINLSQLAGFVVEDLRRQQPERLVDVLIEDGMVVEGDPTLLRTVVENLVGNAWKYSAKRARARIEFLRQPREGHPGQWVYCVRDNGVGFDMRYAGRLFGMFQRLHSANDYQGTGVGLASVRRIVLRHGGEIWAESEVDAGSRFFFTLS